MSYAHLNADPEIASAIQQLLDELVQYERGTGREQLLILLPGGSWGIPVCHLGSRIAPVDALRIASEFPHALAARRTGLRHPDARMRRAVGGLVAALESWERRTGLTHLFVLLPRDRDGAEICHYRDGAMSPRDALRLASFLPHANDTQIPVC